MVKRDFGLRGDTTRGHPASWRPLTNESYVLAGPALYTVQCTALGGPALYFHLGGGRHPPYQHTTMHKGMHRSLGAHESRARWQGVVGGVREGQEGKGGGAGWRQEAPPQPAPVPGACWGSDLPAGRFQPAGYFHTRLVPPPSLVASDEKTPCVSVESVIH